MREFDFARIHGISEAELLAAFIGDGVTRISADVAKLLGRVGELGTVMALSRNESVVHEKIGLYENIQAGPHAAIVLGSQIDLRIFPGKWAFGFAVEKQSEDGPKRSLQFFDAAGEAVHKIHMRDESNLEAYLSIVADLRFDDQSPTLALSSVGDSDASDASKPVGSVADLHEAWSKLTDTHQFFGMLRKFNMTRHQAVTSVGTDFVHRVTEDCVVQLLNDAVTSQTPIMVFVGNSGTIQIHSGPVHKVAPMGPWINVMDPTFHMHLRVDHIVDAYVVRKPTVDGFVTALECYDANQKLIVQFFGQRLEGLDERPDWRQIANNLPAFKVLELA